MTELPSNLFLNAVIIITITMVIFSFIVNHADFRLRVEEHRFERELINFGEAIAGAPCLSEEINGNIRKGLFEKAKLDAAVVDKSKCEIEYAKDYFVEVYTGLNNWEFGNKEVKGTDFKKYPIAIKFSENNIAPGTIKVYLKRD